MSLYFFSVWDGPDDLEDEVRQELPTFEHARRVAREALADIVRETILGDADNQVCVELRDENAVPLYRVSALIKSSLL